MNETASQVSNQSMQTHLNEPTLLGWETIKNDNPHMSGFTVTYEGKHAIVRGFSPRHGVCRADYYFQGGVWVLGAN